MKNIFYAIFYVVMVTFFNCDSSTDSGTRSDSTQKEILILEDNGTQEAISTILSNAGYTVKSGGPYWLYTGECMSSKHSGHFQLKIKVKF